MTQVVYNLFLHPLAKVPGPIFARVCGIPSWYHAICGDRHIWIWQLNQMYGARVRIDPSTVIFFDPTSYNEIYSNSANVQRSRFYTALQRSHYERNTITTVDTQLHAQKRKLLNLSFTEKSLRATSSFMVTHIDRWIELIAGECEDGNKRTVPKDFAERANVLVFDIMGDLCFGNSPNIKETGENPFKSMPHNIATYLKFWYPVRVFIHSQTPLIMILQITRSPFLGLILWLRPRGLDALTAKITPPEIKAYYQFVHDSITKRRSLQEELREKPDSQQRLDMFHFLCESKNPDTGTPAYSQEELWAEANMLILAGADTTAVSLCGIFFYLVRDQIRLENLTYEIRSKFASANDIVPGQKLQSCTYLRACIDEGMRLTPAGPSEMGREIKPGGATINGECYPAGTVVGVAAWAQTRNEVYRDPLVFRPERWIVDSASGVTEENISLCRNNFTSLEGVQARAPGKIWHFSR